MSRVAGSADTALQHVRIKNRCPTKRRIMSILEAREITKSISFNGQLISILKQVNLRVEPGSSIALLGVSGSGKSTLLSLFAGLDDPSSGQMILFGQDLKTVNEAERALLRQSIGFVFQNFFLLPQFTALENVMLPCEIARMTDPKKRAIEALHEVGLGERLDHYPSTLSGGEQQRVALARAFVSRPKLLFADEPTGSLDEASAHEIIQKLYNLKKEYKTTLVMVTHDLEVAKRSDLCYRLEHGVLEAL